MIRAAILASMGLWAVAGAVHAQTSASPVPPPGVASELSPAALKAQLDRIESKLDAIQQRLDQLTPPASGAVATQVPAGAVGSAVPSPVSGAVPDQPGALAVARVAPKTIDGLSNIPTDAVGGFVYTGGPIPLSDIGSRGVRYPGPVGVELQGWLRATAAGRYELAEAFTTHFGVGTTIPPTCFFQAWLEDHSLGENTARLANPGHAEASASLVLGANLQPGLYRLRIWTTCTQPERTPTTAELMIKTPPDMNLRAVTGEEIMHRVR